MFDSPLKAAADGSRVRTSLDTVAADDKAQQQAGGKTDSSSEEVGIEAEEESESVEQVEKAPENASNTNNASSTNDTAASGKPPVDLAKVNTAASEASASQALEQTATREDGSPYPTGARLALVVLALCLAVFLMALDNSIIATAIPKITDQFHSLDDVGWYGSAYLLTTAALQLLFGKFYTFFSIKWTFLVAICLFEVGSLICGVAQNSLSLIMGRAVAGLGSAGMFSGALIILAYSVPLHKRPMYTGLIGSMYGIASVAGPLLGGVFTDKVTWRWCFLINLPIGAVTVAVIGFFFTDPSNDRKPAATDTATSAASAAAPAETKEAFPGDDDATITTADLAADDSGAHSAAAAPPKAENWKTKLLQCDPMGTVLFMPAVICLLLALQWGGTTYAWKSGRVIALLVLFGLLTLAFLYVQYRQQDNATVPPRVFRKRSVWAAAIFSFCLGAGFLSSVYYLPIWFQAVKGSSAVKSGIMNLPMLISLILMSLVTGGLVTKFGYYTPYMLLSSVLAAVGYGLMTTFKPATGHSHWIGYQVLAGLGVGMGIQQALMAVQTVLDIRDVPVGTSAIVFLQTLGGALFVSISQNIFTNKLVQYIHQDVPGLDPKTVLAIGATSIRSTLPPEQLPGVLLAYSDALTKTFAASAAMLAISMIGSLAIEWKSVKGRKIEAAMA